MGIARFEKIMGIARFMAAFETPQYLDLCLEKEIYGRCLVSLGCLRKRQ